MRLERRHTHATAPRIAREGLALQPKNVLFILSDEHQRDVTGCYGNPLVQTPNLDRLAAGGVTFTQASTPCPICVPARSALATGRWVHQTGSWDNAHPYEGEPKSWHHRLSEAGHEVVSIGKLHFRREGQNGFTKEILRCTCWAGRVTSSA